MPTSTVSGTILNAAGTAYNSAVVKATRNATPDMQAQFNSTDPVTATTNSSGVFSLSLYRDSNVPVTYALKMPNGQVGNFTVEPQDVTLNLGRILVPTSAGGRWMSLVLDDNANIYRTPIISQNVTVATTSNTDILLTVPRGGLLAEVYATTGTTLATSDTNFVTFTVTNITNSNAAMVAATNAETTRATGGSAWTANTPRSIAISGTAANLVVAPNDVIRVRFGVTGTLGATLANAHFALRFTN